MSEEKLLTSQVVRASGLQSSALRYYEREGLVSSVGRSGGRRQYDPSVLRRLGLIGLLKDAGFSIAEISGLIRSRRKGPRWKASAEKKLQELDDHLERITVARQLLKAALACECTSLENCEMTTKRSTVHRRAVETIPLGRPPSA